MKLHTVRTAMMILHMNCNLSFSFHLQSILRPSIDDLLKISKLAPKPEKSEAVSSGTTKTTADSPTTTASKELELKSREESLNKKEELLNLRDRATDLCERRLASRERRLEEKERILNAKEKNIAAKECLAEDKVARYWGFYFTCVSFALSNCPGYDFRAYTLSH